VGRVLDTLRALGIAGHTLVFFTSDNGPHGEGGLQSPAFFDSNGPFRGMKRDLYEGGIRTPMIAWGPGRIPAGVVSAHVWALWDVMPTLTEFAGLRPQRGLDGISAVPTLTGRGVQAEHVYLYWEFYEGRTSQAVREGRWKAVRVPMLTGPIELHDLVTDPAEAHDVAAIHPEIVATMRRIMTEAHTPSTIWGTR
jgi:arylsulfatase A-like enzyme